MHNFTRKIRAKEKAQRKKDFKYNFIIAFGVIFFSIIILGNCFVSISDNLGYLV